MPCWLPVLGLSTTLKARKRSGASPNILYRATEQAHTGMSTYVALADVGTVSPSQCQTTYTRRTVPHKHQPTHTLRVALSYHNFIGGGLYFNETHLLRQATYNSNKYMDTTLHPESHADGFQGVSALTRPMLYLPPYIPDIYIGSDAPTPVTSSVRLFRIPSTKVLRCMTRWIPPAGRFF